MCFISDIVVYLLISQILVVVSSENDPSPETFNNTEKYLKTQFLNGSEEDVRKLTLYQSSVEILEADNFTRFKDSLVHLHLVELYGLKFIQKNTFNELSRLQSLYLSRVPKLDTLSLDILENDLVGLKYLHVVLTGIRNVPRLRRISEPIMEIVDFERNSIQIIESNQVVVRANQVIFDHNEITTVESWAFNGSEISKISLKGNVKMSVLSKHAFDGIKSLRVLDLSETSISNVPTNGLKDLETLIIQRTYSLKTIPSIYDFHNLKEADLTFSFHCCAFHLPKRHNPEKYALHKAYVEKMKKTCPEFSSAPSAGFSRSKKGPEDDTSEDEEWHGRRKRQVFMKTLLTEPSNKTMIAFCGNFSLRQDLVKCGPVPNAFNPCEDIMGYKWLRYSVWFVVLTGLCGNICVLMVILGKHAELTVQNLLICNLAFSDLCMAVFLLMLAVEDLISEGVYFNYAYDWQRGVGCKVAGFVSIFSSQLSIFILTLVTVERWFTIKRALYTNRLTIRKTAVIIFFGWLNASVMASLPLFGISSYSAASLCLPMRIETVVDTAYVLFLLFTSFAAFVTICVCYYQIYFSLSYETRHKDGEYVLARKMTILVATDFLCWAPITFFALTAVLGFPLIDITNSKILLVFFYPLNSCANPFLYAILTTNFKRDLVYLLSKIGICRKAARKYKLIYYHPEGNLEHPIPRPLTSQTSV